jgi:hypothetical protein
MIKDNEEKNLCIDCNSNISENELVNKDCKRCTDIYEMDSCYDSILEEKSECSFCKNIKTLFVTPYCVRYVNDNPICRDCYFTKCRECNNNGQLLIPVSKPYDLKCGDCWCNESVFNGQCSLCGDFDYLEFNKNLDRYNENTQFYCEYCFYNENINEEESDDEVEINTVVPIISICDCCKINTNSECHSFLMNDIYKNRKSFIDKRQSDICEAVDDDDDEESSYKSTTHKSLSILSRLISTFQVGEDINIIKKNNNIQIHKISHETKRPSSLPDRYTSSEFEDYMSDAGYDYGIKIHYICSDCFLFGIIKSLTTTGTFPNLRRHIGWFYKGVDKEEVKKLFNDNFELVDNIILPSNINISYYNKWFFSKNNSNIYINIKKKNHVKADDWLEKCNDNNYSINISKLIE